MTDNNKLITLLTTGTWIGMIIGLSFIEAPLKFQAPGISLPLGLGFGKLVFGILSKVEIVFAAILLILYYGLYKQMSRWHICSMIVIILIVSWQVLILLPVLDHRADQVIANQPIPESYHHLAYILAEVVKLISLFIFFVQSFRSNH